MNSFAFLLFYVLKMMLIGNAEKESGNFLPLCPPKSTRFGIFFLNFSIIFFFLGGVYWNFTEISLK